MDRRQILLLVLIRFKQILINFYPPEIIKKRNSFLITFWEKKLTNSFKFVILEENLETIPKYLLNFEKENKVGIGGLSNP